MRTSLRSSSVGVDEIQIYEGNRVSPCFLVGGYGCGGNYSIAGGVPTPHAPVRQRTPVMGPHCRPAARRPGILSAGSVHKFSLFISSIQ